MQECTYPEELVCNVSKTAGAFSADPDMPKVRNLKIHQDIRVTIPVPGQIRRRNAVPDRPEFLELLVIHRDSPAEPHRSHVIVPLVPIEKEEKTRSHKVHPTDQPSLHRTNCAVV